MHINLIINHSILQCIYCINKCDMCQSWSIMKTKKLGGGGGGGGGGGVGGGGGGGCQSWVGRQGSTASQRLGGCYDQRFKML